MSMTRGARVSDFRRVISNRIAQTRGELSRAEQIGDDYLLEVHLGELEALARIAAEHDVAVDGVADALASYGLPPPAGSRAVRPAAPA
jgi:hypothetical protein